MPRSRRSRRHPWIAPAPAALEPLEARLLLADTSFPVILQWFESSYDTIEQRAADIFAAGYGSVYTPPPGRADQGNLSVGYDVYDRFDLGSPGNPTLYGTEKGLKTTVDLVHRLGADYYLDYIINHNGYTNLFSTDGQGHSFYDAGGYPGMVITLPNDIDGDFNSAFDWGDIRGRLAGLLDINHAKNYRFVRNPVPGVANNIRPGTQSAFGRLANVPDENNRRFYPDQSLNPIIVFDPVTGETGIRIYPFNNGNPLAGDPVQENATGYLMRNAQWLVQHIGVDGFRIDAAKHIEGFALDFYDRAVYRTSFRTTLDGAQKQIFSFSEVFDGNQAYLQTFVKKNINPNDPGRIGGNRDTLDFPLYFALRDNLTGNGFQNSWFNVRNATFDLNDDGLHNGSQGVMFFSSHDEGQPHLGNVAAAYMLMHPGNAVVYFNGKEFGDNRDFPKDGRGDALGGVYGNAIPGLVQIRNSHGRGNYIERWIEKELFAYEREASSLVLLNNRVDAGFDSRTLNVNFAPGTHLIELTGNAASSSSDPFNNIPEVITVFNDNGVNKVNARFLRNVAPGTNNFTGNGYLIYGLPAPQAPAGLQLTNVAQVLEGGDPNSGGGSLNYRNGVTRLSDIDVIKADSFAAQIKTVRVNLLGNPALRDVFADGDNALIKIDGGIDINGNGRVDFTTPGTQSYGFEEFFTKKSPLWNNPNGDGEFIQSIDATKLSEGLHFIEVRAFRHRDDGGPAIFSDFKKTIYVDRLKPVSDVVSFNAFTPQFNENRQLLVRSADLTADSVHVLWDLPANMSEGQVLSMVNSGNRAYQLDRDLFGRDAFGVTHGNHVATVVTYEPTGTYNVQRVPGLFTSTIIGRGPGDLNYNGFIQVDDVNTFASIYNSNNTQFNPAADFNGDGLVTSVDLFALGDAIDAAGADQPTREAYRALINNAPTANNDGPYSVAEDGMLDVIASLGVLANDTDPDGDPLFIVGVQGPMHGTLNLNGSTGAFTYTPFAEYSGPDSFTYQVTDGPDASNTATVTINVTPANDAPTVDAGPDQAADEDAPVQFAGSFSDIDPGDTHSIAWDFGDGGSATGTLTPTHTFGSPGLYTVTLTVTDSGGAAVSDTLTVAVSNIDPVADAGADIAALTGQSVTFAGNFTDGDVGDMHLIEWDFGDMSAVVAGTLAPQHAYAAAGEYTVSLRVTDSDGGVSVDTLMVTVSDPPPDLDPPAAIIIDADDVTSAGGRMYDFTVVYTDATAVDLATIGRGDVRLERVSQTKPFVQTVIFLSAESSDGGATVTARYRATPPGRTWDYRDNDLYNLTLQPDQVRDTLGHTHAAAQVLATFRVDVLKPDAKPPTATLSATDLTEPGLSAFAFTVTYRDESGIDPSTIDGMDILVSGPHSYSRLATPISQIISPDGLTAQVTYQIEPWNGIFTSSDNGRYQVTLLANQIFDARGNARTTAQKLGTFRTRL